MRYLFFLLLLLFIDSNALSQSLTGHIAKLEQDIADFKSVNADPGEIKRLEKILEEMKFTQSYLDQKKMPIPKTYASRPRDVSWSGFLSSAIVSSSSLPVSTRNTKINLFFSDAIPTLHRNYPQNDELNFTDDKGGGMLIDHAEITIGNQTYTCHCSGSGASELHEVAINMSDGTYSIDALAPVCTGGTSDDGSCGMTWSITIPDQRLGSPNVLQGTRTVTTEISGIKATVITTWYLVRTIDAELIVKPHNYDYWLPWPGKDEHTEGSLMNISLEVFGKNGNPPKLKAKSFELKLSNTSREPGICLNMPLTVGITLPDLAFLPFPGIITSKESQIASVECKNGTSAGILLAAYDGGGYTTLTATAIMEDNSKLEGHLLISGGKTEIPIPKRPAGSSIGESWLIGNNNPRDADDKETSPGNNNDGDGLSAYEEYRGVMSEGNFLRLDPNKKELGVKMKRTELPLFEDGFIDFEIVSNVVVVPFFENEIGTDRRLNKNKLTAHIYDQYALFLQKGALTGDLGKSFGGPAIPKQISKTVIDQNRIRLSYQDRLAEANSAHQSLGYTEEELFATITAHELCHSVGVKHHGSTAPNSINLTITPDKTQVRIFNYQGIELQKPQHITGRGGDLGNEQSGDVDCIMLNNALCDWSVKTTPDSMFIYEVPLIPLGTKLCNNQIGTGLNSLKGANGNYKYFGNAVNGNCLSQIKLK